MYLFSLWTSWHLRFTQGPTTIIIAEVVEWLIPQADYNGPKQQCWLSLTNPSPILRRDKTTSKALLFITSQPNDTYKLQWSHSPIRQPTLWRLWRKILTIVLHSKVKKIEVSVDPSLYKLWSQKNASNQRVPCQRVWPKCKRYKTLSWFQYKAKNFLIFFIFHISSKTRFSYVQKYFSSICSASCAVPENSTLSFSQISDPALLMLQMKF